MSVEASTAEAMLVSLEESLALSLYPLAVLVSVSAVVLTVEVTQVPPLVSLVVYLFPLVALALELVVVSMVVARLEPLPVSLAASPLLLAALVLVLVEDSTAEVALRAASVSTSAVSSVASLVVRCPASISAVMEASTYRVLLAVLRVFFRVAVTLTAPVSSTLAAFSMVSRAPSAAFPAVLSLVPSVTS